MRRQPMTVTYNIPRVKENYLNKVRFELKEQLGLKNIMQVPTIKKIVLNMGVGKATQQPSLVDSAVRDLTWISGQKPQIRRAKKSISQFKLRQGTPIGVRVTLRGDRMWEFYDRLVTLAIPRIRDFRGLPTKSFDGHGNYSMGVTEQLIFPEVPYDSVDAIKGLEITIVTTATNDEHGKALLRALGFPFRKEG
jgi:large subunit ribosomal protein L5